MANHIGWRVAESDEISRRRPGQGGAASKVGADLGTSALTHGATQYDIAIIVARFSISGVPLAQIRLARALTDAGHRVTLIFGYVGAHEVPVVEGVEVLNLDIAKTRRLLPKLIGYLRRRKPDIVFAAEDHLNAIVLVAAILSGSRARISCSSRVTPFDTYSTTMLSKRWFLKQVSRATAWRATALTCVSQDMVKQYAGIFPGSRHQCIYNIVDDATNRQRLTEPVDDPWIGASAMPLAISAGSLQPWKGFADAIKAIAILRDRGVDLRLLILGEGPQRGELEELIAALRLSDRVRLAGHVDNVLKYFASGDLFVLSSHVEGLPNVLVEAMMCGLPVVATDCPTGPREVLQSGRFGILVPVADPAGLADGIGRALGQPVDQALLKEAIAPFAVDAVLTRHFDSLGG